MKLRPTLSSAPWMLVTTMTVLFSCMPLLSQTLLYPTFTGGGETNMQTNGSPSLAGVPVAGSGKVFCAYADAAENGTLTIGWSTDGINFTLYQTFIAIYSDPAITMSNDGSTLFVTFMDDQQTFPVYTLATQGGYLQYVNRFYPNEWPPTGGVQPALTMDSSGTLLYLAWEGNNYDPNTGVFDGPWINVAALPWQNPSQGWFQTGQAVSYSSMPGSGPAMSVFNGTIYLSYLDSSTGDPQILWNSEPNPVTPSADLGFTAIAGPGGYYKANPAMATFQGVAVEMFNSAYQEDNVWGVGTADYASYGSPYMYGQTLTNSPSLAVAAIGTTQYLFQGGRTNYPGSGPYIWIQSSTANGINPNPQTGGGGKGGGGGCGAHQDCGD
jgi:hypothetical protein